MQRLQTRNVPGKRRDLVGDRKQAHRQLVADGLVRRQRLVGAPQHGPRKQLRVPQGIGDAMGCNRILEVPSISDKCPPWSPRRSENPLVTGKSPERSGGRTAHRRCEGGRGFPQDLMEASPKVEAQFPHEPLPRRSREDQRLSVVGRDDTHAHAWRVVPVVALDVEAAGSRVDDRAHVRADPVRLGTYSVRNSGIDAVGADHDCRSDGP